MKQVFLTAGLFLALSATGCKNGFRALGSNAASLLSLSSSNFRIASAVIPTADSACEIYTPICKAHLELSGSSIDYNADANKDNATCQKRAADYYLYCENSGSEPVSSTYWQAGQKISLSRFPAPQSRCQIRIPNCANHPDFARDFVDYNDAANNDQASCLDRAADFNQYCGSPATATFYKDAVAILSRTAPDPRTTKTYCQIKVPNCEKNPNLATEFVDYNEWSGEDSSLCLNRAAEFHTYCGNSLTNKVTASFVSDSRALGVATFPGDTVCKISVVSCPVAPNLVTPFIDYNEAANKDQAACLIRATDFRNYCGASATASFYKAGVLITSKTVN